MPAPDFTRASLPPPDPSPMMPVTVLAPVFVPLSVSVVVFKPVETPVTAPMLSRLVADVAPAVKAAVPPSPWIAIAVEIVSVWAPLPAAVWMTPPLLSSRLPPLSVNLNADVLEKVIPPMLRLLSTVTTRSAVSVLPNVAMSVLVVPDVAPGMTLPAQLPAVAQFPAASTFQLDEAARAAGRAAKATATAMAVKRFRFTRWCGVCEGRFERSFGSEKKLFCRQFRVSGRVSGSWGRVWSCIFRVKTKA